MTQQSGTDRLFAIDRYGAAAGGTPATAAIQAALDAAAAAGGIVIIPAGTFVTGSLIVKSGTHLLLEEGAVLTGSSNPDDYRRLRRRPALLLADSQSGITIEGSGTIDGRGLDVALTQRERYYQGEIPETHYNHRRNRVTEEERPQIIELVNCEHITISGITLKNGASWVQSYASCTDLKITGITVDSDCYWNNDGIDIDNCQDVMISDCDINTADDGICLKSEHADGCCARIVIEHCRIRSSASAVKLGTASYGGFRDITIRDISVYDTYRSAIALESVDGGILENITVSDINAYNTGNALFIRLGHRNTDGRPAGRVRNISIKKIRVQIPFTRPDTAYRLRGPGLPFFHNPLPASITGIPEQAVENVHLEDIEIAYPGNSNKGLALIPLNGLGRIPEQEAEYPEFTMFEELPAWGLYVRHVSGLTISGARCRLENDDFRPMFLFDDVRNLELTDISHPAHAAVPSVVLHDTAQPVLKKIHLTNVQTVC